MCYFEAYVHWRMTKFSLTFPLLQICHVVGRTLIQNSVFSKTTHADINHSHSCIIDLRDNILNVNNVNNDPDNHGNVFNECNKNNFPIKNSFGYFSITFPNIS